MKINKNSRILLVAGAVFAVIFGTLLFSCKKTVPVNGVNKTVQLEDTVAQKMPMPGDPGTVSVHINNYELYRATPIDLSDRTKLFFVSVSDRYAFNDHPDSLNIPEEAFKGKSAGEAPKIPLEGIYRKRLLRGVGIKETDSLYVYNYAKDILEAYQIKSLKASAVINGYSSDDEKVEQHYYMIGFELPNADTRKFENTEDYDNLVYIGAANIFTQGQVKAIHWADTQSKTFPAHKCKAEKRRRDNVHLNNVYTYTQDGYKYYAQETEFDDVAQSYTGIKIFHVLVKDSQDNIVTDLHIESGEWGAPAKMNNFSADINEAMVSQYTGRLIKAEVPVILGVEWPSFSCESIYFLNRQQTFINLNCDNRH